MQESAAGVKHNGGLTNADRDEIQSSRSLKQQKVSQTKDRGRCARINRQNLRVKNKSHEDRDNMALDKGKAPTSTHKDTGDNDIQEHR